MPHPEKGIFERIQSQVEAMKRFQSVDDYINNAEYWQAELIRLREILLTTKLIETVKWGSPCYTHNDKMVVGLGSFKSYVGLWFFQGALLADRDNVLMNAQEGRTKAMRQWRFSSEKEIKARKIKAYIKEAIELQDQGHEIKPDRSKLVEIPRELKTALARDKKAAAKFKVLTKGRQREFADYISGAKRAETKKRRLEKILPMIKGGVGLNDKYRS